MVAIARKLLIVVWHVLMAKSADRRADAEQVAFKLMVWSWKLSDEQRGGLSSRQFMRAHLIRLGLGEDLTHITRGGTRRPLATIEEVLALRPELRGPPDTAEGGRGVEARFGPAQSTPLVTLMAIEATAIRGLVTPEPCQSHNYVLALFTTFCSLYACPAALPLAW